MNRRDFMKACAAIAMAPSPGPWVTTESGILMPVRKVHSVSDLIVAELTWWQKTSTEPLWQMIKRQVSAKELARGRFDVEVEGASFSVRRVQLEVQQRGPGGELWNATIDGPSVTFGQPSLTRNS